MQIKAFTLIELLIVIVLLTILYSLAFNKLTKNKKADKIEFANISKTVKKLEPNGTSVLYIYGDKCENSILISANRERKLKLNYKKEYQRYPELKNLLYNNQDRLCFRLFFKRGEFQEKFILKTTSKYLLFNPFFQEITPYSTLEDAKKAFATSKPIPKSIDDYY